MAPIVSVNIRTRSLSADWNSGPHHHFRRVVQQGLEYDGYIVLTLDDEVSLAAQVCGQICMQSFVLLPCLHTTPTLPSNSIVMQGAQLKFSKLVDCQESSADARFVKQLEHKTLLDRRHGEPFCLGKVRTL